MSETATTPKGRRGAAPGRAGRPSKCSNKTISHDIRLQVLTALNFVGGVKYLATQAKKNPAAFMALLGKLVNRDDGAGTEGVTFVIRSLHIDAQPVAGVLNSPISAHVQPPLKLVANGDVVEDAQAPAVREDASDE